MHVIYKPPEYINKEKGKLAFPHSSLANANFIPLKKILEDNKATLRNL